MNVDFVLFPVNDIIGIYISAANDSYVYVGHFRIFH